MPQKQQTISIQNMDTDTALAISYEAIKNIGWQTRYAGPDKILATIPGNWGSKGHRIIISITGNELTISSGATNSEAFDLGGKNKKNLAKFAKAFELLKGSITSTTIEERMA